ncbi:alanine racemase [Paenibacillus arenosi]|uniref:Alanine racemase n=1 Tax=Paenibacillus arenosi TaxID=2774142 RepID=A0ABR9AVA9_9BACL|nr:alanine racemase [Paenibacillus arenosi]MBD8497816.1 alanine racemase [Paenibacillus arenosi]
MEHSDLTQSSGIQTCDSTDAIDSFPVLAEAETPFVLIDERKVDHNLKRMAEQASKLGVKLRPHIKTHKMPYFAQKQLDMGAIGITVAKVSEAEVMVEQGITDIFIAYPIVTPSKIRRAAALQERARIIVGVDSEAGAVILNQIAEELQVRLEVRLEIDTGLRRTGVSGDATVRTADRIAACPHLDLTGIFTFRGAMLAGQATTDLHAAGVEESELMLAVADTLRQAGHSIHDISVGSSPTGLTAGTVAGVSEIRPGTYIFNDRMQMAFDLVDRHDCAATIVVTVVSCPYEDQLVIDGGSKAFATDVQPNGAPLFMKGFGHIVEYPDAVLERLSEEHGVIRIQPGHSVQVGDRLHIIPNHICSSLNLYNNVWIHGTESPSQMNIAARGHNW